jgi:hypothetical protein
MCLFMSTFGCVHACMCMRVHVIYLCVAPLNAGGECALCSPRECILYKIK